MAAGSKPGVVVFGTHVMSLLIPLSWNSDPAQRLGALAVHAGAPDLLLLIFSGPLENRELGYWPGGSTAVG